jgi:hypothetical protein
MAQSESLQRAQQLRIQRLYLGYLAWVFVVTAVFITKLADLHPMPWPAIWVHLSLIVFGNTLFYILLKTNRNLSFQDPSLTWLQLVYSFFLGMIPLYYMVESRPVVQIFYIVAFCFGMLRFSLRDHLKLLGIIAALYAAVLIFDYAGRPDFAISHELAQYALFLLALMWFSFFGAYVYNLRQRLHVKKADLNKALNRVDTLSGLLPICASCKKIRNDSGYWQQIDEYIRTHSDAELSHSVCPDCAKKDYPEYNLYDE